MDTIECSGKPDPLADISPNGDVILVVGPRNVRLRIHSLCLRCASKVFGVMFGPRWGEGISEGYPKEVPLVEDDADALRTICCVFHHRNDAVPQAFTPREVLQIAIEANKYDLGVALKYASAQWLQPERSTDSRHWIPYGCSLIIWRYGDIYSAYPGAHSSLQRIIHGASGKWDHKSNYTLENVLYVIALMHPIPTINFPRPIGRAKEPNASGTGPIID
jgi:hypothetical protein